MAATISLCDPAIGVVHYSTKTQEECGRLTMPPSPNRNVLLTLTSLEDSAHIVCGGRDGTVSVWNARLGELSQRLDHGRE
jgi:hypothetical protein